MPVAVTVNVAVCPTVTVSLEGCLVIAGLLAVPEVTVRVAAVLLTLPPELLTITSNFVPLSEEVVAGVLYVALVAPLMLAEFLRH